jgi:hypothetical protein
LKDISGTWIAQDQVVKQMDITAKISTAGCAAVDAAVDAAVWTGLQRERAQ